MTSPKKRIYNAENRNAQAAQTRSRILETARKLFHSEGFERVTIEKIAQSASVSSPTVYALFQSKRGILFALMDEALPIAQIEALVDASNREKDPRKKIKFGAKFARQIYDAERAEMDIYRGASVLGPEFKEMEQGREQRRYLRQEESITAMWKDKSLARELTLTQARDILWALTGRDLYRMLVVEKNWTSDDYEKWLGELLVKALIGEEPTTGSTS